MAGIEAGGFDLIAKSYEDALAAPVAPKWYLDKKYILYLLKQLIKSYVIKLLGYLTALLIKILKSFYMLLKL